MLQVTQYDIQKNGGFLSALSRKSEEYIRSILSQDVIASNLKGKEKYLDRIIVHNNPHLDEYFAQLLFRAILPAEINPGKLDYQEVSITSEDNDLNCKSLFPSSVVFGIGGKVSGGTTPLFLFDEHKSEKRSENTASCSQLVADVFLRKKPLSISTMLREINAIDMHGMAHSQHVGNIIKQLWDAKFVLSSDGTWCTLTPKWKRAIIDAALVAVIYCLQNGIDLFHYSKENNQIFINYANLYKRNAHRRNNGYFKNFTVNHYTDMRIFTSDNAFLRQKNGGFILNKANNKIPQLLMIQKICYACYKCWGDHITNIIMLHFLELLANSRMHFVMAQAEIEAALSQDGDRFRTQLGLIERRLLKNFRVKDRNGLETRDLTILYIAPLEFDIHMAAKNAALNYLNTRHNGCGLLLMENNTMLTKALFAGKSVSEQPGWNTMVDAIQSKEPKAWFKGAPDHILNGNSAHLYRPRSKLDIETLMILAKQYLL